MADLKEAAHQAIVVRWWRAQYPKLWRNLQASANGAVLGGNPRQRAIQMNNLKASGLIVGNADLFLAIPKAHYHGMYIEMKALKGVVSEEQSAFLGDMIDQDYRVKIAYGADDAIEAIQLYMDC